MQVLGVDITTINKAAPGELDDWVIELTADKVKLTVIETLDLCRILREITRAPGALHQKPAPDPTFCEEKV